MYGIGNPFKLSLKDYKCILENEAKVKKSQHAIKQNLKKIEKKEEYTSTQEEYDKLMNQIDESIKKNEERKKIAEKAEPKEDFAMEENKKFMEFAEKLYAGSDYELIDYLKGVSNITDYEADFALNQKELSNNDKGWLIATISYTYDLIDRIIKYMINAESKDLEGFDDSEKDFVNGFVKNYYSEEFVKIFPENQIDILTKSNIDNAETANINLRYLFSEKVVKELVTEEIINKAKTVRVLKKDDAVITVPALPVPEEKTDEEKLNEVVKELELPNVDEPVIFEQPTTMFSVANANSSNNIKFLHKYITDLLGNVNPMYYKDPTNGFINVQLGNGTYLIDPANIYGFGIWSIMALSADTVIINGIGYNDTVLVPLNEKEIVKKILTSNYIVSIEECKMIQDKYCFNNMLVYKYIDMSFTNTSEFIGKFQIADLKAMGDTLAKMIPMMNGFRFRFTKIESPTQFELISDSYVKSPLASNGETAMPCVVPVVLSTNSITKAA